MSTRLDFDDFPGLLEADRQAVQAAKVLRGAVEQLEGNSPEGGWAARARLLRGIAIAVHAAGLDIAYAAGFNAAAGAASEAGAERSESDG